MKKKSTHFVELRNLVHWAIMNFIHKKTEVDVRDERDIILGQWV